MSINERLFSKAIFSLPADPVDRWVALTVDDAPSSFTPALLDILAAHKARATFFAHPDQITTDDRATSMERIAAEHELAHHMPRDERSIFLGKEKFEAEFARAHEALLQYGPAAKRYFRAAFGLYAAGRMDPSLIRYGYDRPLAALGSDRRYWLASFTPWDAARGVTDTPDVAKNEARALRYADQISSKLFPGAIVVFHDGEEDNRAGRAAATLKSIARFLERAAVGGWEVLPLSDAIARATGHVAHPPQDASRPAAA